MVQYDAPAIENAKLRAAANSFAASSDRTKPKYYVLEMRLIRQADTYGACSQLYAGDVVARFRRAKGDKATQWAGMPLAYQQKTPPSSAALIQKLDTRKHCIHAGSAEKHGTCL